MTLTAPQWLKESMEKYDYSGYWWSSDDDYVYFGKDKNLIIKGSLLELFGSMSRSAIRYQIKVLEENKHMKWHSPTDILDTLKDPGSNKPLTITI